MTALHAAGLTTRLGPDREDYDGPAHETTEGEAAVMWAPATNGTTWAMTPIAEMPIPVPGDDRYHVNLRIDEDVSSVLQANGVEIVTPDPPVAIFG